MPTDLTISAKGNSPDKIILNSEFLAQLFNGSFYSQNSYLSNECLNERKSLNTCESNEMTRHTIFQKVPSLKNNDRIIMP